MPVLKTTLFETKQSSMIAKQNLYPEIRLSAQRALIAAVPASLRAVSVEAREGVIYFRCVFDSKATQEDKQLLSCAATELIADFSEPWTIEEEYLTTPKNEPMEHLKILVFLRHEADNQRRLENAPFRTSEIIALNLRPPIQ